MCWGMHVCDWTKKKGKAEVSLGEMVIVGVMVSVQRATMGSERTATLRHLYSFTSHVRCHPLAAINFCLDRGS